MERSFTNDSKTKSLNGGPHSPASSAPTFRGEVVSHTYGFWSDFFNGFRRNPNAFISNRAVQANGGQGSSKDTEQVYDAEAAAAATAFTPLHRQLKSRHLQMIAIGGSIGTGLFVGSGQSLSSGGPASVLIAFALVGTMLYCTVHALGEMAVLFPVSGSFSAFSTRFLDPAWGFAMGWNYALQWLVTLPIEIVAATYTIRYWDDTITPVAWVVIFLAFITFINIFGVRGYGEAEFVMSLIKTAAVIGFILLGIILVSAGSPEGTYIGGRYWHDPGAFNNGFRGLCSVFSTAAFAFSGTELVGLAAAETANPRKALPTAVKQVFWRITLFYIVSLTLVGLLVPYTDPDLLGGASLYDANTSPFVIAIRRSNIMVMPSIFNAVILIAVLSVGNAAVFGSSRTLAALAEQGQAPQIFGYIDRRGRPLVAVSTAILMGFFAFFAGSKYQSQAFDWMIALSGLSAVFSWMSICLAHIRFRRAWHVQGHSLDELAFRSQPGLLGSWIGFSINLLVLIAQFWVGFAPVGYQDNTPAENAESWFQVYLAAPVALIMYFGYKFYWRTPVMRSRLMDLRTGRRDLNLSELLAEERAERSKWSRRRKFYRFFC